jgi:hypothetical protein
VFPQQNDTNKNKKKTDSTMNSEAGQNLEGVDYPESFYNGRNMQQENVQQNGEQQISTPTQDEVKKQLFVRKNVFVTAKFFQNKRYIVLRRTTMGDKPLYINFTIDDVPTVMSDILTSYKNIGGNVHDAIEEMKKNHQEIADVTC